MLAIFSILASALPGFLLNGLHAYLQATTQVAVEKEQTKRQVTLATISAIVATRQAQAAVIQTGMAHKAFWWPWMIAAIPLSVWFGYGIVNTMIPALPHIASIPPGLEPWAQDVWHNIFLPGGIAAGGFAIAGALAQRKA